MKITVIDDEEVLLFLIQKLINDICPECNVQIYSDPMDFLSIGIFDSDLYLIDLSLKVTTGAFVANEIRKNNKYCKIIIFSGFGEDKIKDLFIGIDIQGFYDKLHLLNNIEDIFKKLKEN